MTAERQHYDLANDRLMYFEIIGEITRAETIAAGSSIPEVARLRKLYGRGRWRKRKGIATVRLDDGAVLRAELHWYEAHGIGRRVLRSSDTSTDSDEKLAEAICRLPQEQRL